MVRINGEVREKFGQTIISEAFGEEPEKVGMAPVPEPVAIDEARLYYETLEGMRVELAVGTANSGGTNKFGELFMTPGTERDRVFRNETEPGLIATDADAGAGDGQPVPRRRRLHHRGRGRPLRHRREHRRPHDFRLLELQDHGPARPPAHGARHRRPVPYEELEPSNSRQLRVASFNVENYFPVGGALDGGTISEEEFAEKTARLTDAINDRLERPEIVAVQEVYDLATLRALARSAGGYTAYLEEGNDDRGIDVGFLVKDGIKIEDVTQYGKAAEGPEGSDCSDVEGGLFDRPPLAVEATARGFGGFTVFSNHFASKAAPDECREAQAAFVRDRVAELGERGERVVVAGDLNAFEDEGALRILQDGTTSLDNLWDRAPAGERYSFQFSGRLQTLDHILVTRALQNRISDFATRTSTTTTTSARTQTTATTSRTTTRR